jgi:hypothetical protein
MKTFLHKLLTAVAACSLLVAVPAFASALNIFRIAVPGLVATSTGTGPSDPDFAYVTALLHFDNSATDVKGTSFTNNGAAFSSSVSKFGGYSVQFNGTSNYLSAANNGVFDLGTGDFTIEFWMKSSQNTGYYVGIIGTQSVAGNSTAGMWRISNRMNSTSQLGFDYSTGGSFVDDVFGPNVNDGSWHHVAVTRASGTLRAFVDGVQAPSSFTVNQNLSSGKNLNIGFEPQDSTYYSGNLDDLRVTKGIARYTSSFTPPTAPFPNQ